MKKLFLLLFLFVTIASLAQTKLTIQSNTEKFATVASDHPDRVILSEDIIAEAFGTPEQIKNGQGWVNRSFIWFDLSTIPAGSFVNWARLTLFHVNEQSEEPNNSKLRRITSSWDPASVTWNTQPTTTKRGQVELAASIKNNEDYKNINVTNLVQAMVDNPATSFGFELKSDTEYGSKTVPGQFREMNFKRSPGWPTNYDPKLVLEYTAPGMQPAVTSVALDWIDASTLMTIYPNPCNKAFNCSIKSASTGNMDLRVIDMLGRTVYSQPVNNSNPQMRVNLPSSSAGTYFVILQDNNGEAIISQQIQIN